MQKNLHNKKRRNTSQKKNNLGAGMLPKIERMEHPPQIDTYQVTHSTRLRFTVIAAVVNQQITDSDVLQTMCVATTAIAGFQLFDVFKIKRVEIWAIAQLGTPTTVEIQFPATQGDAAIHSETSLGIRPAYVHAVPSKRSLSSNFTANTGNVILSLTAPAGSIIDLSIVFRTSNQMPVSLSNALVGAAPGEFYFRGLDALAIAGTNFPPPTGIQSI